MIPYSSSTSALLSTFKITEKDFNEIRGLIYIHAGIVIGEAKREMVYGRLVRRLRELNVSSFEEYLAHLKSHEEEELEKFINALTTNLTSFFRESHHFPILANHVTKAKSERTIKIWSAAASTGEEAYSIAMTLADSFGLEQPPFIIMGTDIDTEVLKVARKAIYNAEDVLKLPYHMTRQYFTRDENELPEGKLQIKEAIRALVTFDKLNLQSSHWRIIGPFDAIFCRNVLIYFDRPTQRRILERFVSLLKPNGLLFVGHSESLFHSSDLFKSIGHTVYERVLK